MRNKYKLRIEKEAKKELKVISDLYGEQCIDEAFYEIKEFPFIGKPLSRELNSIMRNVKD